jgi:hypothetical protein
MVRRKGALRRRFSRIILALLLIGIVQVMFNLTSVKGWSNGGFSLDPQNPNYGTHDWIAQHALDWLPYQEKQYIVDNLPAYLYGTELPDNNAAPDGIGDTVYHHVYFNESEIVIDGQGAFRAQWEFDRALYFLKSGDLANASKTAGIMSHYLADVAVFGHVMAANTPWGAETHHADYETYVNDKTNNYTDDFNSYLSFDGSLETISAYNATKDLAYDTTFDTDGDLNCTWMDQNYDWGNPTFANRCGESLNLAVNYLTDVLHTLYTQSTLGDEEKITVFPATDVGVLFENVTKEGPTTVDKTVTVPDPPPGYVLKHQYEIETTAEYSENITVKIIYDIDVVPGVGRDVTPDEEQTLQLIQWNETTLQWENATAYIDRENNLITGETTHLSMFGVTCYQPVHDICITDVILSKTIIGQGYDHLINVTVKNEGNCPETFDITLQANQVEVETLTVNNLPRGACITVTLVWNATGLDYGDYTIVVHSLPVADETDTLDNDFNCGTVKVTVPGDVNGDFELKREDIDILLEGFGSTLGRPAWNVNCDINNDGKTDLGDIVILLDNFTG